MKRRALLCSLPLAATAGSLEAAGSKAKAALISSEDILTGKLIVTGRLGIPLGTIVSVTGAFVDGKVTRAKADEGRVLLRVEKAGEKSFAEPLLFKFEDESGSYSEKRMRSQLPSAARNLFLYETGGYGGIPPDMFKYRLPYAGRAFGFSTFLVIVGDRPLENAQR